MQAFPAVLATKWQDVHFRLGRPPVAWLLVLSFHLQLALGQRKAAAASLMKASRFSDSWRFLSLLRRHRELLRSESPRLLPKPEHVRDLDGRCLVLAEPVLETGQVRRKGVLLVKFTETSGKLFAKFGPETVCQWFRLVLEPSWAGYADPAILCWLNARDPIIVQATELADREMLGVLCANLVPVEFGSGDWIDPNRFAPLVETPSQKYNAISVANFGSWKRNHAFIAAVAAARRKRPGYRAALVLARLGKSSKALKRLRDIIAFHGVEEQLDVLEGLEQKDLRVLFSHADVLVLTSWKEGSSRVIFEAMAADCPVIVLRRNVGVNKDYINEQTGKLVAERQLGNEMATFVRGTQRRSPRAWFLQHLGPENTTRKLVHKLQAVFPQDGWTQGDLLVKANTPEAGYLSKPSGFRPLAAWLTDPHPSEDPNIQAETEVQAQ